MRHLRLLATLALMGASIAAHAEHFQYVVSLQGTYSVGGTDGCTPPFDQPECPKPGYLSALMSFDTPVSGDGSYAVAGDLGDITNFQVDLGELPTDSLYGGINVNGGAASGAVHSIDESEWFSFDWATRQVTYDYDFGYHGANGTFAGTLSAAPEPDMALLMLAGLGALAAVRRRRA